MKGVSIAATLIACAAAKTCEEAEWGTNNQFIGKSGDCYTLTVPLPVPYDPQEETNVALHRFFPESANWCFSVVPHGKATYVCKPNRDKFSYNFVTKPGEEIDVYVYTDIGTFGNIVIGSPDAIGHESVKARRDVRRSFDALKVHVSANTKVDYSSWDTEQGCSGTADYTETDAFGACLPYGDGTAFIYSSCDTKLHVQDYQDEACQKVDGDAYTLALGCYDYGAGYGSDTYVCS